MEEIIKSILDLWDPYRIYMFPDDEYKSYVKPILEFIQDEANINIAAISKFVYNLIPPIEKSPIESLNESISMIEYERFAKAIINIKK